MERVETTEEKLAILQDAIIKATFFDQLTKDDPVVAKFALYLLAHRNYLSSLPYEIMRDYKINWGLGKTLKLKESS